MHSDIDEQTDTHPRRQDSLDTQSDDGQDDAVPMARNSPSTVPDSSGLGLDYGSDDAMESA